MFPLIKTFKSTRIRNAFILNAMVAAFTAILAIEVTQRLDTNESAIYIFMNKITPGINIIFFGILIVGMSLLLYSMCRFICWDVDDDDDDDIYMDIQNPANDSQV